MVSERTAPPIASSEEKGSLGIPHIKRLWSRTVAKRLNQIQGAIPPEDWLNDNTLICGLRLGLRETMQYLYDVQPSFAQFEQWVLEMNGGTLAPSRIERLNAALSGELKTGPSLDPKDCIFTADEMAFWEENGYVVLHSAVSAESCRVAVEVICRYLKMDLNEPDTWYGGTQGHSIWIPLLHHPALEANRQSPRIHKAFAQLWGRTDLWGTTDQSGMNPPERDGWKFPGPDLHWDVSLALPIPFGTQGVLYLADTAASQGAFSCVPGFHRKIGPWLAALPANLDPRHEDLTREAIPIAGEAGDLIIWHHALPHGSSPNRATLPRFVQYINMRPSYWERNPVWR
jgi:hypothetical protein